MSSTTLAAPPQARETPTAEAGASAGAWVVPVLLFSSAAIIVGLLWDISWHMSIGRDTLWSPPHVLEQIGAALAGLSCGWLVLHTTFAGDDAARGRAVRFWGFRGPLGAWVAIWGAFAMIFSVPFDDWWHNAYGLDVEILSPPHVVLLCGMIAIQIGAILLALGHQNRADEKGARRYCFAYAFAAGAMIAMIATMLSEYMLQPNLWRSSFTYQVAALAFPFLLVSVARAGRLHWAATVAALFYMGFFLVTQWVLVQFPATPRLNPIVNPVTHMVAFGLPFVMVGPALAIDAAHRRWNGIGDWKLAAILGVIFVVSMIAIHWPFSGFLLTSPTAQTEIFLADHWPYWSGPGAYRTQFWSPDAGVPLVSGLAIATGLGVLSARAGLWWGGWLRRMRR